MKRILTLALVLAVIWGIGYLYATDVEMYEFRGGTTKTAGQNWLTATDRFYSPFCWYDTTAVVDTFRDTSYTSVAHLGSGTLEKLVVKYYISALDTFGSADSLDTAWLQFQFSNTDSFSSTWLWTYDISAITANQTAYVTWKVTDSDTILTYPGYNYARCRLIYFAQMDSSYASWSESCAYKDKFTSHIPITVKTAYYPIWK